MKKGILIVLVLIVLGGCGWMARELYFPYRGYQGNVVLVIRPGARASAVTEQLAQHGVLAHRLPFLLRYWLGRRHHKTIKAGEYLFDGSLSATAVYWKLVRGEIYLHTVVIPEGSDRFDMARIFQRNVGLNPQKFLAATEDATAIHDLDPEAPSLEGYLFPDTYRFPRGVSASLVLQTMLARFRAVWNLQFRQELQPDDRRLHGVITLASLVEKETPNPAERPIIAGVFTRRLEKGMPLQCDPTLIYAVRLSPDSSGSFGGPVTQSDLGIDSPYNTYLHGGLPPGPICSPGAASIRAALHPAPGMALYFVSNDHGGHVFANTLAEHRRNVERYRKEQESTRPQGQTPAGASQASPSY